MKNGWRRLLCLLLSGILLLGCGPVQALAAEEELVEMVLDETEVQPSDSAPEEQDLMPLELDGDQEEIPENPEDLPLQVNGVQVTTANSGNILGNGTVSYENGILTLDDAQIEAEAPHNAIYATAPLTIVLKGKNTLISHGQYPAIYATHDLVIQSAGQEAAILSAATDAGGVIYVRGTADADGNKRGLTISGNVTLSAEIVNTDGSDAICSANGIRIGEGSTHVKINRSSIGDVYTLPSGYLRIGSQDFVKGEAAWTADGSELEFISESHLGDWTKTETEHYKSCINESCSLSAAVKIGQGAHEQTAQANCQAAAQCSVCGSYGDVNADNHVSEETEYQTTADTHLLVHSCCKAAVAEAVAESHTWEDVLSEDKTVLITQCAVCKAEKGRITASKPEGDETGRIVWDGLPKGVQVDGGIISEILYYTDSTEESQGSVDAPTAPGTYVAVVTLVGRELNPQVVFTIEKRSLETMQVESIPDKEYSFGAILKPSGLTVKDGETTLDPAHYDITYSRKAEDSEAFVPTDNFTDAGTIQVTATAKPEDPHYTGSISTAYQITKATVPEDAFTPVLPEEGSEAVYDGSKKTVPCKQKSAYAMYGLGTAEAEFYQTIDSEATRVDAIDAGTYQVKIRVAESRNYRETLLENTAWSLTILPVETYQDHTRPEQVVGEGVGEFTAPFFTGVQPEGMDAPETVSGTVHYTYGTEQTTDQAETVKTYLESLSDGKTAEIRYTFTPDSANYGAITEPRTIRVTKAALTFRMEDGSPVNPEALKKKDTITYGDPDIVDVSGLTATAKGETDGLDEHFTVKYAMMTNSGYDTDHLLDAPNAGAAQFFVFYNNDNLGGLRYENVKVTSEYINVAQKNPVISKENKPKAKPVIVDSENTPLLVEAQKGQTDEGLPLEYSLDSDGPYQAEVPEVSEAGLYTVWYRPAKQDNYVYPVPAETVQVIAAPTLTATYGDTLADIRDQLPEGFTYNYANPVTNKVGNAGDRTVRLDYTHPKDDIAIPDDYPTLTGFAVPLTVEPKPVKAELRLSGTHYRYTLKADGTPAEKKPVAQVYWETENGMKQMPAEQYQVSYSNNRYPGYAAVTVTSTNYCFTEDSVTEKTFVIYRPGIYSLSIVPETLRGSYSSVTALKEALQSGLTEKAPDNAVCYNVKMQAYEESTATWSPTTEEFYCPADGFSFTIAYPQGTDRSTHTFEVVGISTMTGAESRSIQKVDFELNTNGIEFNMDGYAAVCLAWKKIPTEQMVVTAKEYTIKRNSSTRGTITFTIDEDPTPLTKGKAKAGQKITVDIQNIQANYEIARVEYYATSGGYDADTAPDVVRDKDGSYRFEMPEYNTSIKVTFRKSSGNPRTGDDFPLTFWMSVMCISAAGTVLLVSRRRKRHA